MPGLDPSIIESLDPNMALGRIKIDVRTDFILAPHYSAVYKYVGDELWDRLKSSLRSGVFNPSLPIKLDVPKKTGLTRPGAILAPLDRLIYQLLIDHIAPNVEEILDRSKTFSNVLLTVDPDFQMFEPANFGWKKLHDSIINTYKAGPDLKFSIKADVACFFERIYQHNLINLLHSAGCQSGVVNLLENLLLAWTEKNSHGILQGMFPSDLLGNFYLHWLDSELTIREIPSCRYVDDLYLFFQTLQEARVGLVNLCRSLRNEGLNLNENKSGVIKTEFLLHKETEVDRMFEEARSELEDLAFPEFPYGFATSWLSEEEDSEVYEELELEAIKTLYEKVEEVPDEIGERIERFCLPLLAVEKSDIAVERCLKLIPESPHLSQVYCAYLDNLVVDKPEIVVHLEPFLQNDSITYDWQLIWPLAVLTRASSVKSSAVDAAFRILISSKRSIALRAICAIFIGKHGNPGQRRNLKNHYADESSEYVRSAILFTSRYFPTPERKTCVGSWSGHSTLNSLIGKAVNTLVRK